MSGIIDANDEAIQEELQFNVCIVGAGAAGLSLAKRLCTKLPDIGLIESGGLSLSGSTQGLFAGRQLGLAYHNLASCRLRYWGGTTNHWSGYCRANDPIDYEGRPSLDLPKWPVSGEVLSRYISEAGIELGLESDQSDLSQALLSAGISDSQLLDNYSPILKTKVAQFARHKRLGEHYLDYFSGHDKVTSVLNLNLCHIALKADGSEVDFLETKTLGGKKVRILANKFVIATHAIENARILLTSNDVQPSGIGNDFGHVGKYFMDHIGIKASVMIPSPSFPKYLDYDYAKSQNFNANLSFTDEFLRDRNLLQYYCRFLASTDERIWSAARRVKNALFKPGDLGFVTDVKTVLRSLPSDWGSWARKFQLAWPLPDYFFLEHRLEQAPNPDSKVIISDRRDALGNNIADLHWRLSDHDIDSFARGQTAMANEVAALGLGRVQIEPITRSLVEERIFSHYHQIGTTRMSDSPTEGVVDKNCRVHGVKNLYVAGSSVFPTAGYSGPTMMIIAMAYRLADHLAENGNAAI